MNAPKQPASEIDAIEEAKRNAKQRGDYTGQFTENVDNADERFVFRTLSIPMERLRQTIRSEFMTARGLGAILNLKAMLLKACQRCEASGFWIVATSRSTMAAT